MSQFHRFILCGGLLGCAAFLDGQESASVYRLQSGDTVEVQYRYTPEYNATAVIQPGGSVNLPIAGDVKLQGLTVPEAQSAIADKASERLNQPEVAVLLKEYVRPYFVVAGEVAHPGRFEMHGQMTAVEAIAISGGFKDSSKHSQVLLIRKHDEEMAEVTVVDMKGMTRQSQVTKNPLLQPGDILLVPQNNQSKMERYIRWASVGLVALAFFP
jgi:polysaccharide biosynthesis/export protein